MLSRKKASKKKDSLYTFNEYLDNKDNLATKSLEGHPWSKKFLSKIFQINRKSAYSNEDFDEFISKLDLDNLEKLLYPARIIKATNITSMLFSLNSAINPDVLADTLTVLTSNIDILKNLYTLDIPFSAISSKLSRIESKVPGILKKVLEGSKTMLPNLNKNTYEEICKKRADVLNFVKKIKIKSDAINSANDDVDNNITNQTTIEQNPLDLYIANNNKLKGSLWSTKFFLSKIFQTNRKSACSNGNFDKFISKLDLDNLEKLLYPARIIEATNITNMLSRLNRMINLDVLAKTLTVLTSNIYMLKNLYTLGRSFSTISGKLCHIGSSAPYCLDKLFTFLKIEIELQKNDEDFLTSLKICVQKLDFVKNKGQETRKNVIDIMLKKHSNIQEINNRPLSKLVKVVQNYKCQRSK
ncbi:hypothetical protein [Orientia tsutsugamushi]|uniref:hypothetical protein n=1 Tax=Orientia tsutsugamushi TaxID=784 RepID=UPI000305C14C|nr:hypothetical protein [Orientia tsutsugamushi]